MKYSNQRRTDKSLQLPLQHNIAQFAINDKK